MSDGSIPGASRLLAEQIARALFTNGSGDVAQRLVLTIDKPLHRDLGGWCEGAVVDKIEAAILRAFPVRETAPAEPSAEFKVGDRVNYILPAAPKAGRPDTVREPGTITRVNGVHITVKVDRFDRKRTTSPHCLEPLQDPPVIAAPSGPE